MAFFDGFSAFGAFTITSTPGFSSTSTAAVDAFAAPAARVFELEGDAAALDVSEDESGDAALRRAGRAEAEDVTLSSSLCSLIGEARDHRRNGGLCGAARSKSCGPAKDERVRGVRARRMCLPMRQARFPALGKARRTRLSRAAHARMDRGVRATIVRYFIPYSIEHQ
ncbi:hypothetical protein [Caballeronia sp. SL2Y3]|uniref:hypothetical protein n=1 Tax=Caballeronia sp. SL2Y3 TaxID=2878151 RepID=UPI001FCFCF27|nr:hypothetical protein [Caballeronia sp. SL2Y3]